MGDDAHAPGGMLSQSKDWLAIPPQGVGIVTHDVHRDYEKPV